MRFQITIRDTETGAVRVDCKPDFETMANIAREKSDKLTPAAAYTLGALAHIRKASIENLKLKLEEQSRSGDLPLYNPESKLFN